MEVVILAIALWGVISGASQAAVDHAYARRGGEHPRYDLARQRIAARQARAARRERVRASRGTWREPKTPAAKFARSLFDDAMETAHYKHGVKHAERMEKRRAIDAGERDRGALSGVLVKLRGKVSDRWDVAWGKVGERIDRNGGPDKPGPDAGQDKEQRRADKDEQRRYRDEVRERYAPKPAGQADSGPDNRTPAAGQPVTLVPPQRADADAGQADAPRRRLDGARPDREGWADTGQGTRGYPYYDDEKGAWVADGTVISEDPDWFLSVEADPRVREWIQHRTNGVTDPLEAWQMLNLARLDREKAEQKLAEGARQVAQADAAAYLEGRIPSLITAESMEYAKPIDQAHEEAIAEQADRKFFALRDSGYTGPIDQDGNQVVSMADWIRDNHPLGAEDDNPPVPASPGEARNVFDHEYLKAHGRLPSTAERPTDIHREGVTAAELTALAQTSDTTDAEAHTAPSDTETPIGRAITNMTQTIVPAGEAVTLEGAKGFVDGMLTSTKAGVSACDQGGSDLMTTIKGLKDLCQAAMSACEQAGADMEGSEVGGGITGPIGAGQAKFADALAKVEALEQQANNVFAEVGEALGEAAAELTKAQGELINAEGVRDAYDAAPDAGHKQWVQG